MKDSKWQNEWWKNFWQLSTWSSVIAVQLLWKLGKPSDDIVQNVLHVRITLSLCRSPVALKIICGFVTRNGAHRRRRMQYNVPTTIAGEISFGALETNPKYDGTSQTSKEGQWRNLFWFYLGFTFMAATRCIWFNVTALHFDYLRTEIETTNQPWSRQCVQLWTR